jgi:hypothetical protein
LYGPTGRTKSAIRSFFTGTPSIWTTPATIWIVSPGRPMTRLI